MTEIFIIVKDSGCEGYSGPIQACRTLEEAISIATLMASIERFEIFAVPVWPTTQKTPWFNLEPLWPKS